MALYLRTLGGLMTGAGLLFTYRTAGSVAQGCTDFVAIKQASLSFEATESTFSLLKDMELTTLSRGKRRWVARLIAYPLPFALQILNHQIKADVHPSLKQGILLVRKHIEHIALAVDITVSVLFTYYVAPRYGVGILVGLGIEVLNEYKILPTKVKQIWEQVWIAAAFTRILNVAYFDDVDVWEIGQFIGEMTVFTWENYFQKDQENVLNPVDMGLKDIESCLAKPLEQFKVNWSHVHCNPRLVPKAAQNIDTVKLMEELGDKIDWDEDHNLQKFKHWMLDDPRFQRNYPLMKSISDDFAKDHFKTGARLIATQIAEGSFQKGDAYIRLDVLQGMLKAVLHNISEDIASADSEKRIQATSDLFILALNGGEYCVTGLVEAVESIYKRRILSGNEVPLETKLLYLLTAKRQQWFDRIYGTFARYCYALPRGIIDPSDLHFRNVSMFYFDRAFKLHSEVVKNDMTTMEGGFCSRLNRLILSKFMEFTFWAYALRTKGFYSVEDVIEENINISMVDFSKYLRKWVEVSKLEEKEQILTDLEDRGVLFGHSLMVEEYQLVNGRPTTVPKINPELFKLVLTQTNLIGG